jgi:hypothetical protein
MIIVALFLVNFLVGSEEFQYNISLKGIKAGSALLKLEPLSNSKSKITFIAKSSKLIDFFYKLRDNITMTVDREDLFIYTMNKSIRQGKYKKKTKATFDYESQMIYYNDFKMEFQNQIYSPISLIYYLKKQNLSIKKNFDFQIFENGKIKNISISASNDTIININNSFINCHILNVQAHTKKKELETVMSIYYEDSKDQIPVMIKSKIKQGEMILTIK